MPIKKKLLLIDDSEDVCVLLKRRLENRRRYDVTFSTNSTNVVALAEAESPDLIILDIDMPDTDGGAVAHELLQAESTKGIPILFLSAIVSMHDVEASAGIVGGRHIISKGCSIEDLAVRIESLLA